MDICGAITARKLINFNYDGHQRLVVPAAYGQHATTGNPVLRGYQIGGTSNSRAVPLWDLFLIPKIRDFVILQDDIPEDPPGYARNDKHMSQIHCQL